MKPIYLAIFILIFVSCKKEKSDLVYRTIFEISAKSEMGGPYPPGDPDIKIPVMRVFDQKDNSTFTLSFNQIEGFKFEEGTSFILNIEVTELASPPIDGHLKRYKLINIINKN